MAKIEQMIDLKSFLAGGVVVLIGVYWAIRQQQQQRERFKMERRIFIVTRKKQNKEPAFSEN